MQNNDGIILREFNNIDLHPSDRKVFRKFARRNYPGINNRWNDDEIEFLVLVDTDRSKTYEQCAAERIAGMLVMVPYDGNKHCIKLITVDTKYRKRGLGTRMLIYVAAKYPKEEVIMNVALDRLDSVNFYCSKGYIKKDEECPEFGVAVFLLVNVKLIAQLPLS